MTVTTVTPPASPCIETSAAKLFMRLDGAAEDTLIIDLIATATEQAEKYTDRSFINRTLKLTLDRFPVDRSNEPWWGGVQQGPISLLGGCAAKIKLPHGPVSSVTGIVTYGWDDTATTVQPDAYRLNTAEASIALKEEGQWPLELRNMGAVEITYVAGYGATASALPASIRHAILQQVKALYDFRDCAELCDCAKAVLAPYRLMKL